MNPSISACVECASALLLGQFSACQHNPSKALRCMACQGLLTETCMACGSLKILSCYPDLDTLKGPSANTEAMPSYIPVTASNVPRRILLLPMCPHAWSTDYKLYVGHWKLNCKELKKHTLQILTRRCIKKHKLSQTISIPRPPLSFLPKSPTVRGVHGGWVWGLQFCNKAFRPVQLFLRSVMACTFGKS